MCKFFNFVLNCQMITLRYICSLRRFIKIAKKNSFSNQLRKARFPNDTKKTNQHDSEMTFVVVFEFLKAFQFFFYKNVKAFCTFLIIIKKRVLTAHL